jgi:hypothetical protein
MSHHQSAWFDKGLAHPWRTLGNPPSTNETGGANAHPAALLQLEFARSGAGGLSSASREGPGEGSADRTAASVTAKPKRCIGPQAPSHPACIRKAGWSARVDGCGNEGFVRLRTRRTEEPKRDTSEKARQKGQTSTCIHRLRRIIHLSVRWRDRSVVDGRHRAEHRGREETSGPAHQHFRRSVSVRLVRAAPRRTKHVHAGKERRGHLREPKALSERARANEMVVRAKCTKQLRRP